MASYSAPAGSKPKPAIRQRTVKASTLKMVGRKIARVVPVLLIVTMATTALIDLMPGNPAAIILGPTATEEQIQILNQRYGFEENFFVRYFGWMGGVLTGDFGDSLMTGRPVLDDILQRLPVTFEIATLALTMALIITIPLAIYGAANAGGRVDRFLTGLASSLMSIPAFVGAVILVVLLAINLPVFPVTGWVPFTEDPLANLRHAFLPAFTLALVEVGFFYRLLRGDLATTLQEDFILSARARGLSKAYVMFRHALRPSLFSLITMSGLAFGRLLGGSVVIEFFFALPGLGNLAVVSISGKDIPAIQGIVVVIAVIYVVVNTLVDLAYSVVDPRVKVQ